MAARVYGSAGAQGRAAGARGWLPGAGPGGLSLSLPTAALLRVVKE